MQAAGGDVPGSFEAGRPTIAAAAGRLRVGFEVEGPVLRVRYCADGRDDGLLEARYPFEFDQDAAPMLTPVALGAAVYLGQLCLAASIELEFAASPEMVDDMLPLAEMLYDIRRWKDGLPPGPPPAIRPSSASAYPTADPVVLHDDRSALLWSGGKDSSLSAMLLRDNGYEPLAVHVTANAMVSGAEWQAAHRIARDLGIRLVAVRYDHPSFLSFSSRYAREWNRFPRCNAVPFGRDLLLALLTAPVARWLGAARLSMGHDHECRNAFVTHHGKQVPRNDVESALGAIMLESYLQRHVLPGCSLLPPVSGLWELRILREMLVAHPQVMAETSFCFWSGAPCGRCAKCLRYYLAQRLFDVDVLRFSVDPLAPGACPELDDLLEHSPSAPQGGLFADQVFLCLAAIAAKGGVRPVEAQTLARFERLGTDRDSVEHLDRFLAPCSDPQLPPGFQYPRLD